uniref:Ultraviolet-B receptor UVR8 n=2 Tax=Noccaea caerulescens TaxID=107243 RepID=A0A1J3FWJ4_NOCCA
MAETPNSVSFEDLPSHLILKVLTCDRLNGIDLVNIEMTSKVFGWNQHDSDFKSLADNAASRLSSLHPIFAGLPLNYQKALVARCEGNWKRVWGFLKSIVESSDMVETPRGKMKITMGKKHTLVTNNSKVYSCGKSDDGALGQGPETRKSERLTPIVFPFSAKVIQVSASEYNSAFVMQSGEVFTCGCNHFDNDTYLPVHRPRLVEALKNTPCKQVATGSYSTVFLSREGHVYTAGWNEYGQLGHGDIMKRPVPTVVELLKNVGPVEQISAGPYFVLAVTEDGSVYSFGSGIENCLGHGELLNQFEPHVIQAFKTKGVRILRVCAGYGHAAAIDSNGYVYTWGRGKSGALGHGDQNDKPIPEIVFSLKNHLAVQVCASFMRTFVVVESGLVYGFGASKFGSLGIGGEGHAGEVEQPRVLECLRPHRVSQVSSGLAHTMVVTQEGRLLGFGDNRDSQLGHHSIQTGLEPTEIVLNP